jgi:hypothetical protein
VIANREAESEGFADYPVVPEQGFYSTGNSQFLLPYEAVRTAAEPDRTLPEFYTPPIWRPLNAATGTESHSKSIRAGGMRNSEH